VANDAYGRGTSLARRPHSIFRVGVNGSGNWVAVDQDGHCGGLFVGRDQAIRFALSENGNRQERVLLVSGPLDLDLSAPRTQPSQVNSAAGNPVLPSRQAEP
jgi:hypothetical protein